MPILPGASILRFTAARVYLCPNQVLRVSGGKPTISSQQHRCLSTLQQLQPVGVGPGVWVYGHLDLKKHVYIAGFRLRAFNCRDSQASPQRQKGLPMQLPVCTATAVSTRAVLSKPDIFEVPHPFVQLEHARVVMDGLQGRYV